MVDILPELGRPGTSRSSQNTARQASSVHRVRPASPSRVRSQHVEVTPGYILEWNSQVCRRKFLTCVKDVRDELECKTSDGFRRLFIIHGLPLDYVGVLAAALDIDPEFIEAHAGRRRYRPSRPRKDGGFRCYEYPELVKGYSPTGRRRQSKEAGSVDVMDDPPFHLLSSDGQAALFCRASMWTTTQADVMFLDRPMWRDPTSSIRKARRPASGIPKPYQLRSGTPQHGESVWDVRGADSDEVPSLEDMLLEYCKNPDEFEDVAGLPLPGLIYEHWLDFFETLPPHSRQGTTHDIPLFWQATESLEQNLDASTYARRHGQRSTDIANTPDWQNLLDRIQRRVDISALHASGITLTRAASTDLSNTTRSQNEVARPPAYSPPDDNDANQRSLNRVTYLGGVLLPVTVVSGILSMNDQYMPNGSGFWIFWVASAASAALCLLVIYLDQLRSLEGWFEVTASDTVEALFQLPSMARPTVARRAADGTVLLRPFGDDVVDVPVPQSKVGSDMEMLADSPVNPTILVQRRGDGSGAKAWKKAHLGWGGAVKQAVGYYRWSAGTPMQFNPPGLERFRMKTI